MVNELCISETIVEAVKEVFETMVFMNVEKSADETQQINGDAIMGLITFRNGYKGCLTICCSKVCAKTIALNMLGMEPDAEIDEDGIKDAIGEVTNMVMGSVKSRVQTESHNLQVSIPTIISGHEIENHLAKKETKIIANMTIENQFPAEISFSYIESKD